MKLDDVVFVEEVSGKFVKYKVIGFGEDEFVNGMNVNGMPYVNKYGNSFNYDKNINNYIRTETVRVADE